MDRVCINVTLTEVIEVVSVLVTSSVVILEVASSVVVLEVASSVVVLDMVLVVTSGVTVDMGYTCMVILYRTSTVHGYPT